MRQERGASRTLRNCRPKVGFRPATQDQPLVQLGMQVEAVLVLDGILLEPTHPIAVDGPWRVLNKQRAVGRMRVRLDEGREGELAGLAVRVWLQNISFEVPSRVSVRRLDRCSS